MVMLVTGNQIPKWSLGAEDRCSRTAKSTWAIHNWWKGAETNGKETHYTSWRFVI